MTGENEHRVTTLDELRALYREPSERVRGKKGTRLVGDAARFVEQATFFCLATSGPDGSCDVSPRGGPPGQLVVLDGDRVAFPDLSGNNLLDSLSNLVANPHAGLLVMCPGSDETIRIDGTAELTTDPTMLGRWDHELRRPKIVVVVHVGAVFVHCAKAFRRGGVWDPASWADHADVCAAFNDIVDDHTMAPRAMREFLEADYEATLSDERVSGPDAS